MHRMSALRRKIADRCCDDGRQAWSPGSHISTVTIVGRQCDDELLQQPLPAFVVLTLILGELG